MSRHIQTQLQALEAAAAVVLWNMQLRIKLRILCAEWTECSKRSKYDNEALLAGLLMSLVWISKPVVLYIEESYVADSTISHLSEFCPKKASKMLLWHHGTHLTMTLFHFKFTS